MTADTFSENVQPESDRMGIDGGEAPGARSESDYQ